MGPDPTTLPGKKKNESSQVLKALLHQLSARCMFFKIPVWAIQFLAHLNYLFYLFFNFISFVYLPAILNASSN